MFEAIRIQIIATQDGVARLTRGGRYTMPCSGGMVCVTTLTPELPQKRVYQRKVKCRFPPTGNLDFKFLPTALPPPPIPTHSDVLPWKYLPPHGPKACMQQLRFHRTVLPLSISRCEGKLRRFALGGGRVASLTHMTVLHAQFRRGLCLSCNSGGFP